jgi:hypothetical protein
VKAHCGQVSFSNEIEMGGAREKIVDKGRQATPQGTTKAGRDRQRDGGGLASLGGWGGLHGGLLVPAMGEGETRGDYDSGFGPQYGESGKERGEMGWGGRWPDGEHRPIATRHPPNQSPSYGLLHTRLTYHL